MKRAILFFAAIAFLPVFFLPAWVCGGPCTNSLAPPFIANGTKPNILIILDNSNSMDEDFYGNAVGSFSPASKSVVAKKALRDLVTQLQDKAMVGVMSYTLPSDTQKYKIHNSQYFVSYNPNSYCADPPDACVEYCITGNSSAKSACESACPGVTASFTDSIISSNPANGTIRTTYCPLIYPKTQRAVNPADPSRYIYYKNAYPFYDSSDQGTAFLYSSSYSSLNGPPWNSYRWYRTKTGTADDGSGYGSLFYTGGLQPTDSDMALGYYNFGQRVSWYFVGPTWFSNSSPSSPHGYLKIGVGDLSTTTHFDSVFNMLDPKEDTSNPVPSGTPYMGCTSSNENSCPYIVNAGLTPTAGTLQSALNYFAGTYKKPGQSTAQPTPISTVCQRNYIIYVTDGLPSIKLNGSQTTDLSSLMPEVITQLESLRTGVSLRFDHKWYKFPVKTYVLGMGLSDQAKVNLDAMATAGGTPTLAGHAYYADNAEQLTDALETITTDLLGRVASGSSISILSQGQTQMGANMLQGVFYPSKYYGTKSITWPGYLYNYWFYNSPTTNNIREDTVHDFLLDLDEDNGLTFAFTDQEGLAVNRYSDPTGSGDPSQFVDSVDLDALSPIWEAGKILFGTPHSSRRIYTVGKDAGNHDILVDFNTSNTALTTPGSSLLGSGTNIDACLGGDEATKLQNIIRYVRGEDISGCRSRTVGLCSNGTEYSNQPCIADSDCSIAPFSTCRSGVWKLGDIVYSTPKVQTDYKYCFDGTSYDSQVCTENSDCGVAYPTCQKKENLIFVGANDGMLHAFKTGIETNQGVNSTQHEIEKLVGIDTSEMGKELWAFIPKNSLPYLRCLAGECHLYYSDLSPHITTMVADGQTRTVLIGGMRLGGGALTSVSNAYCFNGSGVSNGQSCSNSSNCTTSPYNVSCSTAMDFSAPSDTCAPLLCSNPDVCYNPPSCVGLSSYYALDITDAESPRLLWEFSHPQLGYSYSGPAIIRKWSNSSTKTGDRYYVMFVSGPTNPSDASSIQSAKAFVLSLDSQLGIDDLYVKDFGNAAMHGFGGRLFNGGLDVNDDGYTDFVFFGYGYSPSGNIDDWKGGIGKINTNNTDAVLALDPRNWAYDVATYSNIAQLPITAKVETMKCFDRWYIYSGTGRYFFPMDNYGPSGLSGRNYIMGVPFTCDQYNENCLPTINYLNDNRNACENLQKGPAYLDKAGWQYTLNDAENGYLKERMTTDPTISASNKVFFTTSEPTDDPCGYGGRTRVWGLNCATGSSIIDTSCSGYTVTDMSGTLYLQTSTGAINKVDPSSSFSDESTDNRTTEWFAGIPPENAPPLVPPTSTLTRSGKIIQWIER